MNKKKFKNVFSKTFVVGIAALAMTGMDVDAATVRENAGKEIENGSYLIGISRFTNDVNITADRVLTASQNDMFFKGLSGYKKPSIYQYRGGNWIKYDEDNNSSLLNATEVEALGLNSQDIYYVNNEEKVLEIAYNRQVASGTKLTFVSDAVGKTIKYEDGVMYVPATTRKIEVKADNVLVETLTKTTETEAGDFDYRTSESAYYGSISADNIFTKESDTVVNGELITINGTINWNDRSVKHGVDYKPADSTKSGHRIGVKITAPNGTNLDSTSLANIKVTIDNQDTEIPWTESNTGKDSSFWFTPIVEAGKTYTVKVVWDDTKGISQTFTIKVNGTLAPMPAGTLSGENIYALDEEGEVTEEVTLSAVASGTNLLTFSGKEIAWDGNVVVDVTANEYYANDSSFTGPINVEAYYSEPIKDADGYDTIKKIPVAITPTYDARTKKITVSNLKFIDTKVGRKVTVSVKWDEDYTQDFDVVLNDNTPFAFPDVRLEGVQTLVGYASDHSEAYNSYEVKDNVATISKTQILWKNGNRVNATVVPSTTSNNDALENKDKLAVYETEELANLTVRVDGEVIGTKDTEGKFTATTLASNMPLDILVKTGNENHTVEILWNGEKVVKTYTIKLEDVSLAVAQKGNYVLNGAKYASELTNDTIYVYMSTFHDLMDKEDPDKVIGQERDSIPFIYDVNANAVVMDFNNSAYDAPKKVEIDGKDAVPTDGGYFVPVYKNALTKIKVYWDDVNVQEFNVAPHATNATFKAAEKGVIKVNDVANEGNDKTTITYDGEIAWKQDGSTKISIAKEKAEDKHGYTLEGVTITAPDGVTPNDVKVTISGGKYSADKDAENFAIVDTSTAVSGKVVTLDPVITSANQTLTIKVNWNGEYVETYTLKVSGADLTADSGTLTATDDTDIPLNRFNGVIPYTSGAYVLATTLNTEATVAQVDIDDARTTIENGEKKLTTITGDHKDIDVQFTNEVRRATVTVTYSEGNKQTFEINATEATIPTVIMNSNLTADKDGVYNIEAKVDENLGTLVSRILPNTGILVEQEVVNTPADGSTKAVIEKNSNGAYVAKTVGTYEFKFNINDAENTAIAKPVAVKISVVNDAVVATSTAAFDGEIINVITNVTGGTKAGYTVEAKVFELITEGENAGLYSTEVAASGTGVLNANKQYVTTITAAEGKTLPKKCKVVVTVADKTEGAGTGALANLVATNEIELPKDVRYTLTFDADGGVPVDSLTDVKPGDMIKEVPSTTKADLITPNGNKYVYTFAGWYLVDSATDKIDMTQPLTAETPISANATYKAVYSSIKYDKDGKEIARTNASGVQFTSINADGNTVTVPQPNASVATETNGDKFTKNISKIKSVDYTDDTITVTFAGDLISYDNGQDTGKWFGILVDLGIDPSDFVVDFSVPGDANGANYAVAQADIDDVAKFGGQTGGTQFIMWLTQEQVGSSTEFRFKDTTTVTIKVVQE